MIDDTRRPESEIDEPVFSSDDQDSTESDIDSQSVIESGADVASETESLPETGLQGEVASNVLGAEEPVFSSGGDASVWQDSEQIQDVQEASHERREWESSSGEPVSVDEYARPSTGNVSEEPDFETQVAADADSDWAEFAPDAETAEEARPATEYSFFEETPAAEVAAVPRPTRKLGRTGPVWVLGGITLVLIAGLVWLGISRLTGSSETNTAAPSEPAVQQVAADAPTPEPPTSTPGPTPTATPVLLPINANVTVANTDGQGVLLRAEPGRAGDFIQTVEEGATLVVLDADPESDHTEYPVPLDGYLWYRMRVPGMSDQEGNPLVGWSASSFFVVEVP